jgi:hypothetical protein
MVENFAHFFHIIKVTLHIASKEYRKKKLLCILGDVKLAILAPSLFQTGLSFANLI